MIDLHCHLLPGIDDGADDLATAVEMCRMAASDGTTALVATPHQRHERWPNPRAGVEPLFAELVSHVSGGPALYLGGEIRVDSGLLDEVDLLPGGSLLPLAGSRWLLLELDPGPVATTNGRPGPEGAVAGALGLVHELVIAGWRPILAHPERIPWLLARAGALPELVTAGATLQLTAMSLTGGFGRRSQQTSHALLDEGLAHFVASDGHDLGRRPPVLSDAYALVADRCGEPAAERLFFHNPAAVLADAELP